MNDTAKTYTYKRYMRDGSMKEITALVRARRKKKKTQEKDNGK